MYGYTDGLVNFVRTELFDVFSQNRRVLEDKWRRNRKIWDGDVTEDWKTSDAGEDDSWRSKISVDLANQKATQAVSLICNMAFKKGQLPLQLDVMDHLGLGADEKKVIDARIFQLQEYMQDCSAKSNAASECTTGFLQASIYGECFYKVFTSGSVDRSYKKDTFGTWLKSETNSSFLGLDYLSIWDIFWDVESKDLQDGRGVIHRQYLSKYDLHSMLGGDFVNDKELVLAIAEEDNNDSYDTSDRSDMYDDIDQKNNNIEYLECWIRVPVRFFTGKEDTEDNGDEVEIMCGVVGNHIIRFVRVEKGDRPFLHQIWERDVESIGNVSVCDRLERYQNSITGSMREFEDNKKLSGNAMMGVKRKMIKNMPEHLRPGTVFDLSEDCETAAEAIQQIVIADIGESLLSHIHLIDQFADRTSNIPSQEMAGVGSGRGIADITQLNANMAKSGKYLLQVVANFDLFLTQYFDRMYDYIMSDEELAHLHGDYKVRSVGFESFENRVVKTASLMQMLTMTAQSPDLSGEMDKTWLIGEIARGLDIDPERATLSDEQKQKESEAEQQNIQNQKEMDHEARLQEIEMQGKIESQKQQFVEQSRNIEHKRDLDELRYKQELKEASPEYLVEMEERRSKIKVNELQKEIELRKLELEERKLEKGI